MNNNSNEGGPCKPPSDLLNNLRSDLKKSIFDEKMYEIDELNRLDQLASLQKNDFYTDPTTGYLVMTSFYLKNRGYCCENKCRHCPY